MQSAFGLVTSLGLLAAMGSGAGSFSVLIGAAALRMQPSERGGASGLINAGGSFGQFAFAPTVQQFIQWAGWMNAMWGMAAATLLALPLIAVLNRQKRVLQPDATPPSASTATHSSTASQDQGVLHAIQVALRNPSYWLLHAGFFTCGFHIAFLVTHLPGEVNLCGMPASVASWSLAIIGLSNIFGSLIAGSCVARYRSKWILSVMYGSRAVLIVWYLLMPRQPWVYYAFAVGLGFTWLATVPPTASIVAKLFGVRYLGTLFGLTLLSHQIGGFLGAWLGGLTITRFGDYGWMWYADIALAAAAALVNLPIREAPVRRLAAG